MRVLVVCNAIYIALHDESYQGAHSERAQKGINSIVRERRKTTADLGE